MIVRMKILTRNIIHWCAKKMAPVQKNDTRCKKNDTCCKKNVTRCKKNDTPSEKVTHII